MSSNQKTDMLIDTLVSQLTPVSPQRSAHFWGLLLLAVGLAVALILAFTTIRPDFLTSFRQWVMGWKTVAPLALGLVLSFLVLQSSQPGLRLRPWHWMTIVLLLAIFWIPGLVDYVRTEGEGVQTLNAAYCLKFVTIASLLPLGLYLFWLRRAAPTHPMRAGALAGLAAGAFGAFAYATHCPYVAMDYISLYYSLPAAGLAMVSALAAKYICRW
jgi:hypothetical protein